MIPRPFPRPLAAAIALGALLAGCPAPGGTPESTLSGGRPGSAASAPGNPPRGSVAAAPSPYTFYVKNEYGTLKGFEHPDRPVQVWQLMLAQGAADFEVAKVRVTITDAPEPGARPDQMFPVFPGMPGAPGGAPGGPPPDASPGPSASPGPDATPPPLPASLRQSPPPFVADERVVERAATELGWPRFLGPGENTLTYPMNAPEVHAFVEKNYFGKALGAQGINRGYAFRVGLTPLDAAGTALQALEGGPLVLEVRAKAF